MESAVLPYETLKKNPSFFDRFSFDDHEQVVICFDKDTGLKAIIGIHNTVLGPAPGGARMWTYASEWEGIYNTTLRIFAHADAAGCTPHEAALRIARARINEKKSTHKK